MLNCIFYSLFCALFLDLSFGSLRYSQINRAFMSSYRGMFEACVVTVGDDGNPIYPYFSQPRLASYISKFIGEKVNRYATNYTLDVVFYLQDGTTKCTSTDLARNVKISLDASINFLFNYSSQKSFSISDRSSL